MSSSKFSDEFKRDAVAQITERGYPVREVSKRLGVSPYSLYAWKKKLAQASSGEAEKDTETRRVRKELARVPTSDALTINLDHSVGAAHPYQAGVPAPGVGARPFQAGYNGSNVSIGNWPICLIPGTWVG